MTAKLIALAAALLLLGCTSPETKRTRGGGRGADLGYRGANIDLHEGAEPYYRTPQLIDSQYAQSGKSGSAEQVSRK